MITLLQVYSLSSNRPSGLPAFSRSTDPVFIQTGPSVFNGVSVFVPYFGLSLVLKCYFMPYAIKSVFNTLYCKFC